MLQGTFDVCGFRDKSFDCDRRGSHKASKDVFLDTSHHNSQLVCFGGLKIGAVAESQDIFHKANDAFVRALDSRLKKLFVAFSPLLVGEGTSEHSLHLLPEGHRRFVVFRQILCCCL